MATQMSEADRVAFIAEANKRAQANGTSVTAELSKAATQNGLSMADAEVMMGYPVGTLGGTSSASSNLGMGSNTGSGAYLLDAGKREAAVSEAQRRARESGRSAEQELYSYAQSQGASNSDLDTYMGMNPGASANFARVNAGQGGIAAPSGNSYVAPVRGAVSAGDNRWSGDPTKNPDGTTKTSRGYDSTNSTTGWDVMGPGWNPGGSNLGMGDTPYQRNPYLDAAARDVGSNMFDQWNRNVAPGLRSGAMATGGYGGSRQGVVEANSLNDMNRQYGQALTNMYSQDYTGFQNRGIQRQGQNQSYDLGLRSSDLGYASLDANIAQNNFGNQLASANFGLGVQDYLNKNNQAGITAGTNIQNTGLDYQKYYNDAIKGYGNAGGTRNGTTTT